MDRGIPSAAAARGHRGWIPGDEEGRHWLLVLAAAVVSWLGFVLHNLADLPGQTLASPETLYPTVLTALLLALYRIGPRRLADGVLLAWAVLHFVGGGILSVLPLGIFPFQPEQSVRHYAFHALYALTQIPLLLATLQGVRKRA